MNKYEYVLWDWNGTLLDDLDMNLEIAHCLMQSRDAVGSLTKEFYLEEFGFPIYDFYLKLGFDFEKHDYNDIAVDYENEFQKRLPGAKLFPDAVPVIEKLRSAGLRNVIISATEHSVLTRQVESFRVTNMFDAVLGNKNNLGKSKVQVAVDWMKENGVDPKKVAFIGDTIHDFETAKAIGCDCFFVANGHNSKGRLLKTGCEVFDSLTEVSERLTQKNKRVILAPDSFKGSLSATRVCEIIGETLREKYTDIDIIEVPIADGGEGTVDSYLHIFSGKRKSVKVKSPLGNDITAEYAILSDGTAVIETAAASGIAIEKKNNALLASTYGTGQLIRDALDNGCKKIILGLGGSATTDGGTGCASGLGAKFLTENGDLIPLGGIGLEQLHSIDFSEMDKRIFEIELCVLCDVKNPLYGENGAAFVYAGQKGANSEEILRLDKALRHLSDVAKETLKADYSQESGAGAAGGMGFACLAFFKGKLKGGIDCILDAVNFESIARSADIVITGEGKMDRQSLMGKAVFGVARRSGSTKVIAVVGSNEADSDDVKKAGVAEVIETNPNHLPFDEIKHRAAQDLKLAARKIVI